MKKEEIVQEVISALERKNWEKVEQQLTEDFTFSGSVPKPINKKDWVEVHRTIQSGIPDLKFNLHQVIAKGDKVLAKVNLEGTHTVDMPAAKFMDAKSIPKTGKKLRLPEEELEFSFTGDKISNLSVKPVPHGGVRGIYEQLGEGYTVDESTY